MLKIINWLKDSNRWLHILGGFLIGILSNDLYCMFLSGIGISSALELKDKLWGGKVDLIDFIVTLLGVLIGYGLRVLIF